MKSYSGHFTPSIVEMPSTLFPFPYSFRIHGVPAATYESASTRMFLGGRTETIRSCSEESTSFCRTMLDGGVSFDEKFKSLKSAVNAHRSYTMEVSPIFFDLNNFHIRCGSLLSDLLFLLFLTGLQGTRCRPSSFGFETDCAGSWH